MLFNSYIIRYAISIITCVRLISQTTVLDGRTGKPLINPYIRDSVGAQASPLTLSVKGQLGHDLFMYWSADCLEHEGEGDTFEFVEGSSEIYFFCCSKVFLYRKV